MNIISVRPEHAGDFDAIDNLVQDTYRHVPYSNHREHLMVRRLRDSPAHVPELSLVAEVDGELAGHIMLTRIRIHDAESDSPSLALAPLSVCPAFQRKGIGAALVEAAHERARALRFPSVIVVGISGYYERFGYRPLDAYPIKLPFEVHRDHRWAIALVPGGLAGVGGMVEYAPEWLQA